MQHRATTSVTMLGFFGVSSVEMSVSNMSSSSLGEPPDLGSSAADGDRHPGRLPWDANLLSPAVAANEVVVAVDAVCYCCMFNFLHISMPSKWPEHYYIFHYHS